MAETNKELVVIEQKDVAFYGDDLTAVRAADGHVYASVRHMCDALGIDTQGQTQRIRRNKVLSSGLMVCKIHTIQGERAANMLRNDLIALWLAGISTRSIRDDETREKLERFQERAAVVLHEAFRDGRLTMAEPFDELLDAQADAPDVQAYKMLMAMAKMARQQILLRQQLEAHTGQLGDHERRLEDIEARLADPQRLLSSDQATRISQAVKAIAHELGKRSGRNEYGGVYGELYRRYQIPDYKSLPSAKFDEAMNWLRQWYASLVDGADVPF